MPGLGSRVIDKQMGGIRTQRLATMGGGGHHPSRLGPEEGGGVMRVQGTIGGFSRSWNLRGDRNAVELPCEAGRKGGGMLRPLTCLGSTNYAATSHWLSQQEVG